LHGRYIRLALDAQVLVIDIALVLVSRCTIPCINSTARHQHCSFSACQVMIGRKYFASISFLPYPRQRYCIVVAVIILALTDPKPYKDIITEGCRCNIIYPSRGIQYTTYMRHKPFQNATRRLPNPSTGISIQQRQHSSDILLLLLACYTRLTRLSAQVSHDIHTYYLSCSFTQSSPSCLHDARSVMHSNYSIVDAPMSCDYLEAAPDKLA
jgi:hypothetical protein